jgi:sigma-E factor negative regulatory protein RseC
MKNPCVQVKVLTSMPLQEGDEVLIGISENALLRGSLLAYMLPVVAMMLGALLGDTLFFSGGEEITILLGIFGLVVGFVGLRLVTFLIQADARFQPVVLRRLSPVKFSQEEE